MKQNRVLCCQAAFRATPSSLNTTEKEALCPSMRTCYHVSSLPLMRRTIPREAFPSRCFLHSPAPALVLFLVISPARNIISRPLTVPAGFPLVRHARSFLALSRLDPMGRWSLCLLLNKGRDRRGCRRSRRFKYEKCKSGVLTGGGDEVRNRGPRNDFAFAGLFATFLRFRADGIRDGCSRCVFALRSYTRPTCPTRHPS